jgi:hypothetical protein
MILMQMNPGAGILPIPVSAAGLSSTGSSYSSFAGILAGFSFTALAIYLGWRPEEKGGEPALGHDKSQPSQDAPLPDKYIQRTTVAAALFYAMASLVICSFLYASLTAQASDAQKRVPAELLLYGVVFGLSVLALFYALTLMMYERSHTRQAASYAYWVVVIAGPVVVLRFLIDAANGVWQLRCTPACPPEAWPAPVIVGLGLLVVLLVLSVVITVFRLLHWWDWSRELLRRLYRRPTAPTVVVFILATCVTVGSLIITVPAQITPNGWFTLISLVTGFIFLASFALACGCVIGPRVEIGLPRWLETVLKSIGLKGIWAGIRRRGETRLGRHAREAFQANGSEPPPLADESVRALRGQDPDPDSAGE